MSYPLGADLFNGLLEICGVDTIRGLVWTGLAGAAMTGYALWLWGGAFGVAALLFNGGLAGFVVLSTLQIEDFQREMVWKNLFLSMFVTQRGLLFALPAGLLLLSVWRDRYFRSQDRRVPFWLQLLLYSSMPFFSLHAFLFLSVTLLAIFLALFFSEERLISKSPSASNGTHFRSLSFRPSFHKRPILEIVALVAAAFLPRLPAYSSSPDFSQLHRESGGLPPGSWEAHKGIWKYGSGISASPCHSR